MERLGHLTPEPVSHHTVPTMLDSREQKGARQNPYSSHQRSPRSQGRWQVVGRAARSKRGARVPNGGEQLVNVRIVET